MFKKLSAAIIAFLLIITLSLQLDAAQKIKLGVLRFDSPEELLNEADIITDSFMKTLSASDMLTVLNRTRNHSAVHAEGSLDEASALGKSEGCEYILLGSVKRGEGTVAAVRVLNVDTSEIIFSISTSFISRETSSIRAEGTKLGDRVRERLTGESPRVLSVKGRDVSINRGSSSGVRKGDLYRVYTEYTQTMDMEGNTSGRNAVDLAIVEVKSVQKDTSTANLLKNGGSSRILPDLNNEKAEAISREEAQELINQKAFALSTIKRRVSDMPTSDLARELNSNARVSEADLALVRDLAEKGHPKAQAMLGSYYMNARNFRTALKWFNEAASQGNADAYNQLGFMYDNGLGVPLNHNKAFEFYIKAAEYGVPSAQNNIGMMYQEGKGVKQDYRQAILWFAKAWKQSDDVKSSATAANNMAYMYYNGWAVKRNVRTAFSLYREAARKGLLAAKINTGKLIFNTLKANTIKSVKKDSQDYALLEEAKKWFVDAKEQSAMTNNMEALNEAGRYLEIISRIAIE